MNNHSELAGSVKPYFARSSPRNTPATSEANEPPITQEAGDTLDEVVLLSVAPQDIIRATAQAGGWLIMDDGGSFVVVVPIGKDRTQTVSVQFEHRDEIGRPLVVYSSRCGPATNKNAMALLRQTARLFQTSFATEERDDGELTVLRGFQLSDGLNSTEAMRMIKMVARHADSIERTLVGTDEF